MLTEVKGLCVCSYKAIEMRRDYHETSRWFRHYDVKETLYSPKTNIQSIDGFKQVAHLKKIGLKRFKNVNVIDVFDRVGGSRKSLRTYRYKV